MKIFEKEKNQNYSMYKLIIINYLLFINCIYQNSHIKL